jgi:hypothetical protein
MHRLNLQSKTYTQRYFDIEFADAKNLTSLIVDSIFTPIFNFFVIM